MKKTLIIILSIAVIFVVGVFAYNIIGKNESKENEGIVDNAQIGGNTEKNEDESTGTDWEEKKEEMKTLKIYGNIYATYPSKWRVEESSRTYVIFQEESCLVGITSKRASSFDGELEDIVDYLSGAFANDVSSYSKGLLMGQEIRTASVSRTNIAGIDCVKFTGDINNNDNWDCHVYGYGLIVEDRVMMVTGLVSEKKQDAAKIAEIDALTDQIAESIRVKK